MNHFVQTLPGYLHLEISQNAKEYPERGIVMMLTVLSFFTCALPNGPALSCGADNFQLAEYKTSSR